LRTPNGANDRKKRSKPICAGTKVAQQMIVPKYQLVPIIKMMAPPIWDLQDDAIIEKVGCHGAQRTQQR
jgi:hypothetical protein